MLIGIANRISIKFLLIDPQYWPFLICLAFLQEIEELIVAAIFFCCAVSFGALGINRCLPSPL